MRIPFLCLFLFAILSFVGMLHVKTDVQKLSNTYAELKSEKSNLQEDVRVLQAEYAHLTNPARLWKIAEKLGLEEVKLSQTARYSVDADIVPASLNGVQY